MNVVEKRIEQVLKQIDKSAECVARHGKNAVSTFDNLKRLTKDVQSAYKEEIDTGITYIEPKIKIAGSIERSILGLMIGSSLLTAIITAGTIFTFVDYGHKNELIKNEPVKVIEASTDDFIELSK